MSKPNYVLWVNKYIRDYVSANPNTSLSHAEIKHKGTMAYRQKYSGGCYMGGAKPKSILKKPGSKKSNKEVGLRFLKRKKNEGHVTARRRPTEEDPEPGPEYGPSKPLSSKELKKDMENLKDLLETNNERRLEKKKKYSKIDEKIDLYEKIKGKLTRLRRKGDKLESRHAAVAERDIDELINRIEEIDMEEKKKIDKLESRNYPTEKQLKFILDKLKLNDAIVGKADGLLNQIKKIDKRNTANIRGTYNSLYDTMKKNKVSIRKEFDHVNKNMKKIESNANIRQSQLKSTIENLLKSIINQHFVELNKSVGEYKAILESQNAEVIRIVLEILDLIKRYVVPQNLINFDSGPLPPLPPRPNQEYQNIMEQENPDDVLFQAMLPMQPQMDEDELEDVIPEDELEDVIPEDELEDINPEDIGSGRHRKVGRPSKKNLAAARYRKLKKAEMKKRLTYRKKEAKNKK